MAMSVAPDCEEHASPGRFCSAAWDPSSVDCTGALGSITVSERFQVRRLRAIVEAVAATRSIELKTEVPGPRSRAILERKARVVAAPLFATFPIVAAEAEGALLTDVDGNTFIDFTGGVGCLNVGHSHPKVVAAAAGAARALRPHRLHDRPLRAVRRARRAPLRARADLRPGEGGVLQRRHRGGRERGQVRARLHEAPGGDRVRGRLPRADADVALADLEDASVQGGLRAVRARGVPRAVPERRTAGRPPPRRSRRSSGRWSRRSPPRRSRRS